MWVDKTIYVRVSKKSNLNNSNCPNLFFLKPQDNQQKYHAALAQVISMTSEFTESSEGV